MPGASVIKRSGFTTFSGFGPHSEKWQPALNKDLALAWPWPGPGLLRTDSLASLGMHLLLATSVWAAGLLECHFLSHCAQEAQQIINITNELEKSTFFHDRFRSERTMFKLECRGPQALVPEPRHGCLEVGSWILGRELGNLKKRKGSMYVCMYV